MATDDEWVIDGANMELIRVHKQMRKALYQPKEGLTPIPLEFLDTKRKTIMEFHKGKSVVEEDDWSSGELPAAKAGENAPREAFHRERYPRLLFLPQLLRMIRTFKTSILPFREIRKSFREELQRSLR